MHRNLFTIHLLEKREQVPGGFQIKMHFQVKNVFNDALPQSITHRQHHWAESELEVDHSVKFFSMADLKNPISFSQVTAHGFLNHHCCPIRQGLQDFSDDKGWGHKIKDCVRSRCHINQSFNIFLGFQAPLLSNIFQIFRVDIMNSENR